MGVMACGRTDCRNIMCHKTVLCSDRDHSQYICDDCWSELIDYKETWNCDTMYLRDVQENIEKFMETPPGTYILKKVDKSAIDKEFNRLTDIR